jgi:protein required for attachment to host cells
MTSTTYLIVADSSHADIYQIDATFQSLQLVQKQEHSASRQTRQELDSDRPGRTASAGRGFHGLGGDQNTHQHESDEFARQLGHYLHQEHLAGKFQHLLLAAPPHFLGSVRQHLSSDCQKVLGKTVNKNLSRLSAAEILAHFG